MFDPIKAGRQITLLRKSRTITQEELAQKLSVSSQAVSKWENGRAMPEIYRCCIFSYPQHLL